MNRNLSDIDVKVIKFLLSAGVYSDLAIVKNLGITFEELEVAYSNLLKEGYLETYEEYQKREKEECPSNSHCSSCASEKCGNSCSNSLDNYSDVKVITWKAINEFQD